MRLISCCRCCVSKSGAGRILMEGPQTDWLPSLAASSLTSPCKAINHHEASATERKERYYRTCRGALSLGQTGASPHSHASDSDLRGGRTHAGGLWQGKSARKGVATTR